jgi:hypothetical protein
MCPLDYYIGAGRETDIFDRPDAIKERMRDGVLSRVKPHLLKPYLMKRDDYTSAGIEKTVSISLVFGRSFITNSRYNSSQPNYHNGRDFKDRCTDSRNLL